MDSLLSVVVPVYNVEEYLDKCIASIVSQTYGNLEIILIDDGSTDNSGRLCDQWKARDERIVVVHKANEGLVRARKTGVELASGKYVGYVDSDDWIEPQMYELLMGLAERENCDVVTSGRIEEHPNGSRRCPNRMKEGLYTGEKRKDLLSSMLYDASGALFSLYPTVWDKVFRRELLLDWQMKVPDEICTGEDVACVYPLLLHAERVYVSNQCLYHYNRCRTNSMLGAKDRAYFDRVYVINDYLQDVFAGYEVSLNLEEQRRRYIWDLSVNGVAKEFGIFYNTQGADVIRYLFPYERIPKGAKVILYGGGNVGKEFAKQLRLNRYCELVAWVDERWKSLGLDDINCLTTQEYDYVIIGAVNFDAVAGIRKKIISFGVDEAKIVWKDYRLTEEG